MKQYKLPFNINLERKYNEINIDSYFTDRALHHEQRQKRELEMENDLHIELGKFKTFHIELEEIIDLGMRYALGKQEFRKLIAQVIELKKDNLK